MTTFHTARLVTYERVVCNKKTILESQCDDDDDDDNEDDCLDYELTTYISVLLCIVFYEQIKHQTHRMLL